MATRETQRTGSAAPTAASDPGAPTAPAAEPAELRAPLPGAELPGSSPLDTIPDGLSAVPEQGRVDARLVEGVGPDRPEATGRGGLADDRFDGLGDVPTAGHELDGPELRAGDADFRDNDPFNDFHDLDELDVAGQQVLDGRTPDAFDALPGDSSRSDPTSFISDGGGGAPAPYYEPGETYVGKKMEGIDGFIGGVGDAAAGSGLVLETGPVGAAIGVFTTSYGITRSIMEYDPADGLDTATDVGLGAAGVTSALMDAVDASSGVKAPGTLGKVIDAVGLAKKYLPMPHEGSGSAGEEGTTTPGATSGTEEVAGTPDEEGSAESGSTKVEETSGGVPDEDYIPGEGPADPDQLAHLYAISDLDSIARNMAIDAYARETSDITEDPMAGQYGGGATTVDPSVLEQYVDGAGPVSPGLADYEDLPDAQDLASPYVSESDGL